MLREVRRESRSRARLAMDIGLTKATVSSLVVELESRGLLRVHEPAREGIIGRPSQRVELVPRRVVGLGLEVNVDYLSAVMLDLAGAPVVTKLMSADVAKMPPSQAIAGLASLADDVAADVLSADPRTVLAGVGVAVPGLVDVATGSVRTAPNIHWHDVALRDELATNLAREGVALFIDNEANLAAVGEHRDPAMAGIEELLYLTGEVGIGAGVITGGRLLRGARGYAGEVGHMALDPDGEICGCGRRGCWETLCGLAAFLAAAADDGDPIRDYRLDLDELLELVIQRARAGHPRTVEALGLVGSRLGVGASVLVNVINPEVLVLGGYFARLGEFLLPPMMAQLHERVIAEDAGGCQVQLSGLGFAAAATGAAHLALDAVLEDPLLIPSIANRRLSVRHLIVEEVSW